tara:strand:- start:5 stop:1039 length:1035 start_codon:yes stop_codon:yes gene_type:complete
MKKNTKNILITGAAGFIGYSLCKSLLDSNFNIIGIDNINDFYDVNLKLDRLKDLGIDKSNALKAKVLSSSSIFGEKLKFLKMNLENKDELDNLFKNGKFDVVCNLAAQAGVRYSIENPYAYIDSNIIAFINILECCRHYKVSKLVYASSSSVYGKNDNIPFSEYENVDKPVSLYAATKKSNELMAHTYSHLYKFETIGLRFFTVYGPWGRPDMALFLFTKAIINNKKIDVFNYGNHSRDFTYIDDIIYGVKKIISNESKDKSLYKIYNIGNTKPVKLLDFISLIEKNLNKSCEKNLLPMQLGDVGKTFSDTSKLEKDYGYKPNTSIEKGVENFINWYLSYYNIK